MEDINAKIVAVDERCKSNSHRIEEQGKKIEKLEEKTETIYTINTNIERLCLSLSHTNEKLDETNDKLDENILDVKTVKREIMEVKNAPAIESAERWKKFIGYIFTAVGGGVLMYILQTVFPVIFG